MLRKHDNLREKISNLTQAEDVSDILSFMGVDHLD